MRWKAKFAKYMLLVLLYNILVPNISKKYCAFTQNKKLLKSLKQFTEMDRKGSI